MRDQGRTAGLEGRLLALLEQEEQEERQARWRSLPAEARRAAVEQLARMMLRTLARGRGDEAGDADPADAS